jgi:NADPH:quinone reductase-like Zn-dependent oxidoreductase
MPQDVIHPAEFETPRLNAGQALVEVVAAPINPSDVMTLTGEYGQLPPLPAIGGREGVGRVAELGGDARDVAVGQLVLLPVGCGSWSTRVVTEAAQRRGSRCSAPAARPCTGQVADQIANTSRNTRARSPRSVTFIA